jgi:hypothetical protein
MSNTLPVPLPEPPRGFHYYRAAEEVLRAPELFAYQHMLLRAWSEMNLSGVLTLNGIPTVYLRDVLKPLSPAQAAEAQWQFWNQGVATVLVLRDPQKLRVFSSMTAPVNPETATEADLDERLVESLDLASQASWAERFYVQLGIGQYYAAASREARFKPDQTVDAYLLRNLAAVRDELVNQGLQPRYAHAFLGRILFTCYLCDRGLIKLSNYFKGKSWRHLHDLLASPEDSLPALYDTLFPALKADFNSSMFDDDGIAQERFLMRPVHFQIVQRFLHGDDLAKGADQRSLGFWAYDFRFIPVETISAIYENFLEKEDGEGKHAAGAFYTPRFLAELTLDLALEKLSPLYAAGRRFIDPACGSGIFLVLLFNRLASEWRAAQTGEPTAQAKAEALLERLDALRGVDKNLTACRIACFSLYLAFLDQFDPPDVKAYRLHTGKKLPDLLRKKGKQPPQHPVVHEEDFFALAEKWRGQFDVVVGNPPWAGRGSKQIAHQFMEKTPNLLKKTGRACLVLPSKVFLSQNDAFQAAWLRRITLEKVIQLADYSFILFKEALCPCNIVRFVPSAPDEAHEIEYVAPKVSRADLRDGVIQVAPQDRKWIPLRYILAGAEQKAASVAWKSRLWGTSRDLKFLDYLFTFPRLGEQVDMLSKSKQKRTRPWTTGQGCKPREIGAKSRPDRDLKPLGNWKETDSFLPARLLNGLITVPALFCPTLKQHFETERYIPDKLYSKPDEAIFTPPLVLFNQGFSEFGFFDRTVRFQDALQSIAGPKKDSEKLLFLACYLRSKLARYFVFQTAANIATERDKAHLFEVLRLPFFLDQMECASANAGALLGRVVAKARQLKQEMEDGAAKLGEQRGSKVFRLQTDDEETETQEREKWLASQKAKTAKLEAEINPLIYDYFGLSAQERALVEDTCDIFDKSDTPSSLDAARDIPTLQPLGAEGLDPYATMLTETLNGWTTGKLRVSATGGVDADCGLGLVELGQVRAPRPFQPRRVSETLGAALKRIQEASAEQQGHLMFRRSGWFFDGKRIILVKPALRGQWTRTAALNDAAELGAHIAEARWSSNPK